MANHGHRQWHPGRPAPGGYDPFYFDITSALHDQGEQQLRVEVYDPTDDGAQPHGKQHLRPEGIWYTPTTGIWQTVWLEPVPNSAIEHLHIVPDVDNSQLRLRVDVDGPTAGLTVEAIALAGGQPVATVTGTPGEALVLEIDDPKLWSPDKPFLYDLQVRLLSKGRPLDAVTSYFGLRKIEIKPIDGIIRLVLNGTPQFQIGPLDQGFWPDGLYTAPTDEALRYDIEVTKQLGYNMTRKHVKVEPARWYYWCDKLGLLVWQDMPHGHRRQREAPHFERELQRMIVSFGHHPSIIMWVVFNEGWGQYRTEYFTDLAKQLDPTRLVSNASGWTDKQVGDIVDMHAYPGPLSPQPEPRRAAVLGEFGGLGLAIEGHTWQDKNWSYRGTAGREELTLAYANLLQQVYELQQSPGLSAAVYTQITDVEGEINGLLTYDREVIKVDVNRVAAANRKAFPTTDAILPTAQAEPVDWKYTFEQPADDWYQPNFDDQTWSTGPAGFGTEGTPGATVRTTWNSEHIYLRREFELSDPATADFALEIHHDEDVEIYINGTLAATATGYTTSYGWLAFSDKGRAALRPGQNLIAVHCKQTGGGQYIDLGLLRLCWPD